MTKSGDDNKAEEEARSDCKAANQPPESSSQALTDAAPPNHNRARALNSASNKELGFLGLRLSSALAQAQRGLKSRKRQGRKVSPHQDAGMEFKPLSKAHREASVQPLHINLPP